MLTATIMGYRDVMGTSAPPTEARSSEGIALRRLLEEQAALRRVATLVAQNAQPAEVFEAVSAEVGRLVPADAAAVARYETDGTATLLGGWSRIGGFPLQVGDRFSIDVGTGARAVYETSRPARIDSYADASGKIVDRARTAGWRSSVAAPIVVEGGLWGFVTAASTSDRPLPLDTEKRLAEFTVLVATAIASSQAREQLAELADEQAALRRVATLVAEGAPPDRVFDAVRREVARMFNSPLSALMRYDGDGVATAMSSGEGKFGPLVGSWPVHDDWSAVAQVCRTGRPARADYTRPLRGPLAQVALREGTRSSVAVPVIVDGALWGVVTVGSREKQAFPADAERRLERFTELLASAIANSQAHEQLAQLASEQAALRRVATLVAEGAGPDRVFDAVLEEVARMFEAPLSTLTRYDGEGTATVLATDNEHLGPVGRTWAVEDDDSAIAQVCRTGRPARVDYTGSTALRISDVARRTLARSAVGVPVVVDGAFWGVMAVGSRGAEPLPSNAEYRLGKLTELLATAIANAEGRAELDASRARIVATADATRRRIERDLHDGAQQQLVALALAVRAAQATVPEELDQHRGELSRVVDGLTAVLDDLRETALGIHPAGLSEDGLPPALKRLVARSPLRVNLQVRADGRFGEPVEVTAYYVVSESLTNAAKHADCPVVDVAVAADSAALRVEVHDDGRGGADPAAGSGLVGLRDRVEAIGGTMRLTSPPGVGTSLVVELPLGDPAARR